MTISEMRKNDWCGFVNNVAEYVLGYKWMHCPASHVSCDSAGQLIPPEKQSANWIGWIDGCNPEIPKGHWAYISQTWVEDVAHDVSAGYRAAMRKKKGGK